MRTLSITLLYMFLLIPTLFAQEKIFEFNVDSSDFVLKNKFIELLEQEKDYSESAINKLIKKFNELFDLENIVVTTTENEQKLIIHFIIIPRYKVENLAFHGNQFLSDSTLKGIVTIKKFQGINEVDTENEKKSILDAYRKKGFLNAQVKIEKIFKQQSSGVSFVFTLDEGERVRIAKIYFEGFEKFHSKKLEDELEIKTGDFYEQERVSKSQEKIKKLLLKNGFITSQLSEPELRYEITTDTYELRFSAVLGLQYKIAFKGDVEFDEEEINEYLGYDRFFSQELVVKEEERKIHEFYEEHGYQYTKIKTTVFQNENIKKIEFKIELDKQIEIEDTDFVGNKEITTQKLHSVVKRYFDRSEFKDTYSEKNIRGMIDELIDYYKQEGFLEVAIIITNRAIDDDEATVTLSITEGRRILVDHINFNFVEKKSTISREELMNLVGFKVGSPFNYYDFQNASNTMKSYYQERGFSAVAIREQVHFEDPNKAIVEYGIAEGEQSLIGLISIKGNKRTNERRIRERIELPFGEPLSQKKLFEAKRSLYKMGLFQNIEIIDDGIIPDTHFHNLIIIVYELNAISFEFGPGFATLNREGAFLFEDNIVRGFAGFNHKNLDGEAKSLDVRASVQRRIPNAEITERKISIGIRQPNIFYTEVNTGINYINARIDKVEFDVDENTLVLSADRELTEKVKGTIHYTFEFSDTFNVVSAEEDTGLLRLGSISLGLERFDVDNRLNPRQGIINSLKLSLYNHYFASEEEFYTAVGRTDFLYEIYKNFNFHISLRGGYAQTYAGTTEIPIQKRFFLGGTGTVRGFKEDYVGTPETFLNNSPIGGRIFTNYVGEFIFPIYKEFRGALFSDGGNVYRDESNFDITNVRKSAGPGLRYDTPVGPIKADFGFKLDKKENESIGEFHFSVGFIW